MQKFEYPKQPIILLAKSQHYDTSKKYYLNINCFFNKKENKKQIENKIDIINCFQLHLKKEILEGIDWFCEACNSYQICEKQLSIYYLPIYLIIQIDRFAIKKSNVKSNIDNSVISIPINNLDLNNIDLTNEEEREFSKKEFEIYRDFLDENEWEKLSAEIMEKVRPLVEKKCIETENRNQLEDFIRGQIRRRVYAATDIKPVTMLHVCYLS